MEYVVQMDIMKWHMEQLQDEFANSKGGLELIEDAPKSGQKYQQKLKKIKKKSEDIIARDARYTVGDIQCS